MAVNKRQFVKQRKGSWKTFAEMIRRGVGIRRGSTVSERNDFSRGLRELAYDLSVVRSHSWSGELEEYLNAMLTRGYNLFYRERSGGFRRLSQWLMIGFPRVFRRNWPYFVFAAMIFVGPFVFCWVLMQTNPQLASQVLPQAQLNMYDQMYGGDVVEQEAFSDSRNMMAGFYVYNNIGIALKAFALGFLIIPCLYVLLYNAIVLGTTAGYIIAQGSAERFLGFTISHGSFELTAIVVSGGAGLLLGHAWVQPGSRTRRESLRVRGGDAVQIAAGAAFMLFTAALLEAFWSPLPLPLAAKIPVAAMLWLMVFGYLFLAGRGTES